MKNNLLILKRHPQCFKLYEEYYVIKLLISNALARITKIKINKHFRQHCASVKPAGKLVGVDGALFMRERYIPIR